MNELTELQKEVINAIDKEIESIKTLKEWAFAELKECLKKEEEDKEIEKETGKKSKNNYTGIPYLKELISRYQGQLRDLSDIKSDFDLEKFLDYASKKPTVTLNSVKYKVIDYFNELNLLTEDKIKKADDKIKNRNNKYLYYNPKHEAIGETITAIKTLLNQREMYENTLKESKLSDVAREKINEELDKTNKEIEKLFSNVDSICDDKKCNQEPEEFDKQKEKDYLDVINSKKTLSTSRIIKNNLFLVNLPKEIEITKYSIERVDFVANTNTIKITVREVTGNELINAVKNIGKEFDKITIDILDTVGITSYTNVFNKVTLLDNIEEDSFDYSDDDIHKIVLTFAFEKREIKCHQ